MSSSPSDPRLPLSVLPLHYDLHLVPDFTTFRFTGVVEIQLEVTQETQTILVNVNELEIQQVSFPDVVSENNLLDSFRVDPQSQRLIIQLSEPVEKTALLTLEIHYTGSINDSNAGFYRCEYQDRQGTQKYGGVTQFESTDARKALPCFDEPGFKSTFQVTITAPQGLTVLNNMPVRTVQYDGVTKTATYTFEQTPKMSVYLLAWVVGEYDFVEGRTHEMTLEDGTVVPSIPVRVYTPLGKSAQGTFALDCGIRLLEFYNSWFGEPFPLPKMDLIAVERMNAGAMENWGLITYRETLLLLSPNSSSDTKQQIAIVVAHELSHQWFGNLVTMNWWTNLWLNEGFATWCEYFATDHVFPEWGLWQQFVAESVQPALVVDALKGSHPIQVPVHHPDEIDEIFDSISYNKGGSVVRMLQTWLGDEEFRKGIQVYIKRFLYGNATSEDLWDTLEKTSGKPVSRMMQGWTKQQGYPVIVLDRSDGYNTLTVTQHRWGIQGFENGPWKNDPTLWMCPISVTVAKGNAHGESKNHVTTYDAGILDERSGEVTLDPTNPKNAPLYGTQSGGWIKLNSGARSFYRVLYPKEQREQLQQAIADQDPGLGTEDRLELQADMWAFCFAGVVTLEEYKNFTEGYRNETEEAVWTCLCGNFQALVRLFKNRVDWAEEEEDRTLSSSEPHMTDDIKPPEYWKKAQAQLAHWIFKFCEPIVGHLGWSSKPNEPIQDSLVRSKVADMLILVSQSSHPPSPRNEIIENFPAYYRLAVQSKDLSVGQDLISQDLRDCLFTAVVQTGHQLGYELVLDLYQHVADSQEDKVRLLRALGNAGSYALIQESYDFSTDMSQVRKQDAISMYCQMVRVNLQEYWKFLKVNWAMLLQRYGASFGMARLITNLVYGGTPGFLGDLRVFFIDQKDQHPAPAGELAVQQTVERVEGNVRFVGRLK